MTKAIYLKTLFKDFKPNKTVGKLIEDTILNSNGIDADVYIKVIQNRKSKQQDTLDGRKFILKHTGEFLEYAIDYSMMDKMQEFLKSE